MILVNIFDDVQNRDTGFSPSLYCENKTHLFLDIQLKI